MGALHRLHYSDSVTPIMYCFIDGEERETGLTNIIWAVSQQFLSDALCLFWASIW